MDDDVRPFESLHENYRTVTFTLLSPHAILVSLVNMDECIYVERVIVGNGVQLMYFDSLQEYDIWKDQNA